MKNLGISFLDAHGKMAPLDQLMPVIIDHLKHMTNITERDTLARKLFGRSFQDLAPLILAGGAAFVSAEGDAARFGNNLSQGQVDALNQYKIAQAKAHEALDGFVGTMGEKALPLLMALENGIQAIVIWWNHLSPAIRSFVMDAMFAVATIGTLIGGFAALKDGLGIITKMAPELGGLLSGLLGPIVGLVAPIAIAVGLFLALKLAYDHIAVVHQLLEPLVHRLGDAFHFVMNAVNPAIEVFQRFHDPVSAIEVLFWKLGVPMDFILKVVDTMKAGWVTLREGLNQIGNQVLPTLREAWTSLHPAMLQIQEALPKLEPLWNLLKFALGAIIALMLMGLGGVFKALVNFLAYALPTAIRLGVDVLKILIDVFSMVADSVQNLARFFDDLVHGRFTAAWNDLKKLFMDGGLDLLRLVVDLAAGILHLVVGLAATVGATVWGFVQGIIDTFMWLFNKLIGHSIIPDLINGIVSWFTSLPGRVLAIIRTLASDMLGAAAAIGGALINGIGNGMGGLQHVIFHALKMALQNLPLGAGNAVVSALGLSGYAGGGVVGPGYGGAQIAMVGEGKETEVIATLSQAVRAGMMAASGMKGGGEQTVVVNVILDGRTIQRSISKGIASDMRLQGGTLGSAA
jgi:hypothetical protein